MFRGIDLPLRDSRLILQCNHSQARFLLILEVDLSGYPAISEWLDMGWNNVHHNEENAEAIFLPELLYSVVYVFRMQTMITEREEKTASRCAEYII
jgi:hypothetical protein